MEKDIYEQYLEAGVTPGKTQTEELAKRIGEILDEIVADYCEEDRPLIPRKIRSIQILQACKKDGLMFCTLDSPFDVLGEIEIDG